MSSPAYPLRLATRADGTRDGQLVLVSPDQARCVAVPAIARTLQAALDDWAAVAPQLDRLAMQFEREGWGRPDSAEPFDARRCAAPLPRAFQWADASVYRNHARLIYKWRKEPIPPRYEEEPLVYQGGSDVMLAGHDPIEVESETHDADFEAEIAVITTDVPIGVTAAQAMECIALVVLLNDISLRGLIPAELSRGFGFYQSKPSTSFAPVAVTPAALGDAWRDGMLHLPVHIELNGRLFGTPDAGEETVFHFGEIIAHLARTRVLGAGSIVGAGTISNADPARGSACITEARVRQALIGLADDEQQSYLRHGDRVRMFVPDREHQSIFGAIDQVVRYRGNMESVD